MKFLDIKQMTSPPNYCINIPWDGLLDFIERHKDIGVELNPDFQRGHVWTEEQQVSYIEYRLKGGYAGRDIYFNCRGWMCNWEGPIYCVDGLQRITAVQQFLNNKIKAFGTYFSEFEDKLRHTGYDFTLHMHNLRTKAAVIQWYLDLNFKGTPHTEEELEKVSKLLVLSKGGA